jgi:PAS domain S-box-containing protein
MTCMVLGGVFLSACVAWIEFNRVRTLSQLQITQESQLLARNIQNIMRDLCRDDHKKASPRLLHESIAPLMNLDFISAARVRLPDQQPVELGYWPNSKDSQIIVWPLSESAVTSGLEVDQRRLTLIQAPFKIRNSTAMVELIVDGRSSIWRTWSSVINHISLHWFFLGIMILLGLYLLRRWFTGPLSEVLQLINAHAGAEPFYRVARNDKGEFSQLAESIGGMLTRLENTTDRLRKRERAFENLYHFAPAPLISLDPKGLIIEANHRAAQLFNISNESQLVGRRVMEFIRTTDRGMLKQAIDRLEVNQSPRCEVALSSGKKTRNVVIECAGVRDEDGMLQRVRLALQDVTELRELQLEIEDHSRLMKLLINHMSDGLLLVDQNDNIAACNERLAMLLHTSADAITGKPYDPTAFWDELGILNHGAFVRRIKQIAGESERSGRERFDTRVGTFLFQGIPVQDQDTCQRGRLWVVQDITSQVQSQQLLIQQTQQLQGLKNLGQKLFGVTTVEQLLTFAGTQLYEIFNVEAVGIALRGDSHAWRSRQVIHRGSNPYLLEPNRELVEEIERNFLPQIISQREITYWPDTPRSTRWGKAFSRSGLTSLAACPLVGHADPMGVLWIARRGGERIERHHLYLLEALAPLIASRLEIARLGSRLSNLQLTDPTTDLPNQQHMLFELTRYLKQPQLTTALCVVHLNRVEALKHMIDQSKINDLLRAIGTTLKRHSRSSSIVGKLRGNDYAIICPGVDKDAAQAIVDRLYTAICKHHAFTTPDGTQWEQTASISCVMLADHPIPASQLLQLAISKASSPQPHRMPETDPTSEDRQAG